MLGQYLSVALLCGLFLLACDPSVAGDGLHPPCPGGAAHCVDLRFVAHEDDDLLFMNPDLAASLAHGNRVVTVFLTAGTVEDEARLTEREVGILNAYAFMLDPRFAVAAREGCANMLAHWRLNGGAPVAIGSERVVQYDFVDETPSGARLSLVFLRLVETHRTLDLPALWNGEAGSISTVACVSGCALGSAAPAQQYSSEELVDTLELLMTRFDAEAGNEPVVVSTLDATHLFHRDEGDTRGFQDNRDHIAAAGFAVSAFVRHHRRERADGPLHLRQYRGYNIGLEGANLDEAQVRDKRRAFYRYYVLGEAMQGAADDGTPIEYTNRDPDDPHFWLRSYENWTARQYAVTSAGSEHGQLAVDELRCLRRSGAALTVGACDDAPAWVLTTRHQLQPADDPSLCVEVSATNLASLRACAPPAQAEPQTFVWTSTGQLRAKDATCVQGDADVVRAVACDKRVDANGDPSGRALAGQEWSFTQPRAE